MEYFKTNIKVILFFLLTLFIFLNAAIEPFIIQDMRIIEFPQSDPMFFQIYSSSILLSFIALCAFSNVDFKGLKPIDWVIATAFGVAVLLPMLISASSANISFAVATFFAYLFSVTISNKYGNRMPLLKSTKPLNIAVDVGIVVAIAIILVWFSANSWSFAESFSLNNIVLWPLAASIGEEVIFRLFLFYVIVKLSKDNNPPLFITLLVLVITSSIWHVVGMSMQYGLLYGLSNLYPHLFTATILSILALKRGLFSAMLLHFLINSIQGFIIIT